MLETLLRFPIDIGDVLDMDFRVSPDSHQASGGGLISIQGFGKRQILVLSEGHRELPAAWPAAEFPHIRSISAGRILLVDTSSPDVNGDNAYLLTETGRLERRFHLGAGVIDVITCGHGAIAAAYHPDAALEFGLESGPMAGTGVAVFDDTGGLVASLNNDLEHDGWTASNIQCLAARESGELVLIPEFLKGPKDELHSPFVFYDWRTGRIRVEESAFSRPLALSAKDASLLVYSPEESEDELIQCDLRGRKVKSLGFFKHVFRGLSKGRFLAQLSGIEYSVIEMPPERPLSTESRVARFALLP